MQLAIPPGGEGEACGFSCGLLGLRDVGKPAGFAGRRGDDVLAKVTRMHIADPAGNRIELIAAADGGFTGRA